MKNIIPDTQLGVDKHTVQQLVNNLNTLRTGGISFYSISIRKSDSCSPFFLKRATAHDLPRCGWAPPQFPVILFVLPYYLSWATSFAYHFCSCCPKWEGRLLVLANKALWSHWYERCYACEDGVSRFFRQLFCLMLKFKKHIIKITKC